MEKTRFTASFLQPVKASKIQNEKKLMLKELSRSFSG